MVYRYLEMMKNVLQTVQTQIRKEQSDLGDQSDLEQSDPVCISLSVSKFRKIMVPCKYFQVSKFLDVSGAKLDYRRYSDVLFDILFAGGQLGKRFYIT